MRKKLRNDDDEKKRKKSFHAFSTPSFLKGSTALGAELALGVGKAALGAARGLRLDLRAALAAELGARGQLVPAAAHRAARRLCGGGGRGRSSAGLLGRSHGRRRHVRERRDLRALLRRKLGALLLARDHARTLARRRVAHTVVRRRHVRLLAVPVWMMGSDCMKEK